MQLNELCVLAMQVCEITDNYKMGFLSINEMIYQIQSVTQDIEFLKSEIRKEYGINDTAITLMLTL